MSVSEIGNIVYGLYEGDASTTPFSLTVMTALTGHATKRIIADPITGAPIVDPSRNLGIGKGTANHLTIAGLAGLAELLSPSQPQLTKRQALIHGIVKGSTPGSVCAVVKRELLKTTPHTTTIARTLEHLHYAPLHLLMFDVDPDPERRYALASAAELVAFLARRWPLLREAGYLSTVSTSRAIFHKQTGECLRKPEGLHVYLLVRGNVARFREIVKAALWCDNTGYCLLAKVNSFNGVAAVLERCMVDVSVFSPERLDYVAGCEIAPNLPFEQRRPDPELHDGGILDLDALSDVTPEEREQYHTLLQEAKAKEAPKRFAKCLEHVAQEVDEATGALKYDADQVPQEATRRIALADRGLLAPDHPIIMDNGHVVLVKDITKKHHLVSCHDPEEPDYGPGHAIIYVNSPTHICIHSLAHGFSKNFFPEGQRPPERAQTTAQAPTQDDDDPLDPGIYGKAGTDHQPPKGKTQAALLLNLAASAHLIHTPEGQRFAVVPVQDHQEVLAIGEKGSGFRDWLLRRFRDTEGGSPSTTALSQAIEATGADARFDGEQCEVYTRLAAHKDAIYLDLANPSWEVVEIDADGWRLTRKAPVYFRRPNGMLPLKAPDPSGTMEDLLGLLPVPATSDEGYLLLAWLVGTFLPHGSYAHLCIHGEQGTAKTTITRNLRRLVDPNKANARSAPKEERDLVIAAKNGAIVALENLSHLPQWLSDVLCSFSTGSGFSARSLYTDDEEALFAFQRPVVMNGIAEVATSDDLIDRSLFVMLPVIPDTARKTDKEIESAFLATQPKALGALLDAVSTALFNSQRIQASPLPRMADFTLWVEAAAPAFDWNPGDFLRTYLANRKAAAQLALGASRLAGVLLNYLNNPVVHDGKLVARETLMPVLIEELLQALSDSVTDFDKKKVPHGWPQNARALSVQLRRHAQALRREGWEYTFLTHTNKGTPIHFTRKDVSEDSAQNSDAKSDAKLPVKICVTFASPVASPINPFGDNGLGVGDASDANLLPSSVRRKKEEEKKRKDARKMGQKMGSDDAQEGSSIPGRKFASLASLASKHTIVDESIVEGCDDDSIRQAGDEPPF